MARRALYLFFILHLVVPPRTLAEMLSPLVIAPRPASSETAPVERPPQAPGKVCPCTGNPSCKCCGCCDDATDAAPDDGSPKPTDSDDDGDPRQKSDTGRTITRCTCQRVVGLMASAEYLSDPRLSAVQLYQPKSESVLADRDLYSSAFLSIDIPPPKDLV